MTTTNSFEAGSEFRVTWETSRPNPRYSRYNRQHQDIVTLHKSDIFDTYEQAEAFAATVGHQGTLQVRQPGRKIFTLVSYAKRIDV